MDSKGSTEGGGCRVWAIVVTYQPELERLVALLAALKPQASGVLIVDNGPGECFASRPDVCDDPKVKWLAMGSNVGVAAAHNAGIRAARALGASHVVLFDQDSLPAPDMVDRLRAASATAGARGLRVASVGPRFYDPRDGIYFPFIRLRGWRIERVDQPDERGYCVADYLITSGCLIALDVLDEVGGLDEELFIDYVDIEWGLRARAHGYVHLGVFEARMEHPLGDPPRWILRGRVRVPMHSPLRHYYHFRNAVTVYRRSYVPWRWSLNDASRLMLKLFFYGFCIPEHRRHLRMIRRAMHDAFRGSLGAFKEN